MPEAETERTFALAREAALLLVVGSSLEIYPVEGLLQETLDAGGELAIVHLRRTPYDRVATLKLDGPAGEIPPALLWTASRGSSVIIHP